MKSERRNLSDEIESLKNQQESFRQGIYELDELREILFHKKKEEESEKARTEVLEEKIKELSRYIREENTQLKELENNVFSQRLNQIIIQHNQQSAIL